MQERPRATAVVRVAPDHAACYWQAISATLARIGASGTRLEVSVLEPPTGASEASTPALIQLEMRSADLDQATLDDAIRQTSPDCATHGGHAAVSINARTRSPTDASTHDGTVAAPLSTHLDLTINSPLADRLQTTVAAPLRQPVESVADMVAPDRAGRLRPTEAPVGNLVDRAEPSTGVSSVPSLSEQPRLWLPTLKSFEGRVVELVKVAAILLAIFIGVRSLIQTFSVDGPSMLPNFETGQRLLVNRAVYWHIDGSPFEGLIPYTKQGSVAYVFGGPHRGDVVMFRPPGESNFESDLIKRIIGLPGDIVSIQAGVVYVNGEPVIEPYVKFPADYTYPGSGTAVLVPNDSYFVLGDNRPVSADSHLGWLVPADKLVGEAWLSYWPIQRWGIVPHLERGPGDL